MIDWFEDFHFLRPWFLLLAIVPFLLQGLYRNGNAAVSSWQKVIDPKLLDFLLVKEASNKRKLLMLTSLLGFFSAAIIMAGPSWEKKEVPVMQKQNPVMIMLNMSSDMDIDDVKPTRLERAKYKIKDFLEKLTATQTAIGVYSDEPFIVAPFTDDVRILHNLLPVLSLDVMPTNGDRLDRAIALGADRIKEAGYEQGNLVIFTSDVGQKLNLAIDEAKTAATKGIKVNLIAISSANDEKLKMITQSGEGKYFNIINDDKQIDNWIETINQANAPLEKSKNLSQQWLDGGWYFMFIPLLCCLLLFRKGLLILMLFCCVGEAQAGFFTNANQDGLIAFNSQDYALAEKTFKDKDWKAASYYRQGKYAEALQNYSLNNSIEGLYNQGNALAKLGKIQEAIAKYEEVLKMQPNHEDAKFNLEYLKQQQQQNQQQQSNQSSQQNDNNENQSSENEQNDDEAQNNNQNNTSDSNNSEGQDQKQSQENNQESNDDKNNNEKQDQSSQQQENERQNQTSAAEEQTNDNDNKADQSHGSTVNQQTNNQQQPQKEQNKEGQAEMQDGEEDYDEKVQAKMQRYREIPEDPGGLLRAFIAEEYRKNRYK